jgi:hypothetical protein
VVGTLWTSCRGISLSLILAQEDREVITENIKLPDTSLIPFPGNKPVPVNKVISSMYSSVPQSTQRGKEQAAVPSETDDDMDEMEQTAKVMRVSTMVNRLQMLKQRIDTQSMTLAAIPPGGRGDRDEQM